MTTRQSANHSTEKIAELNDEFRRTMEGCVVTRGIAAMGPAVKDVFVGVRDFRDFNENNDPYGEHDFGSLSVQGEKIFWKIDYYDEDLRRWCDPLSPDCRRVLTVMLAEEY